MPGRWALVLSCFFSVCPVVASADAPSPNQQLCTLEQQQRDGSQCLACSYGRLNDGQLEVACATAIERGYTERCAFGGMWIQAVYCDREANFIEAARGSGTSSATAEPVESEPEPEPDPAAEPEPPSESAGSMPPPEARETAGSAPSGSAPSSGTSSRSTSSGSCSAGVAAQPSWVFAVPLLPLLGLWLFKRRRGSRLPAP